MDSTFQRQLLDAFMSDYQRVYLVDLIKNQIYMQVNSDRANEDTFPWMEAAIDPTISFEKFIHYYSEYSVEKEHRERFESQMSTENIRTTLLGRNSFTVSCPLVSGEWRRVEIRRFDRERGIAKTALICIPFFSFADELSFYFHDIRSRGTGALLGGSITTCEMDVTDYRILRGTIYEPNIFYPFSDLKVPSDFSEIVKIWSDHIISGNRNEADILISQDYLLSCYEQGNREPWIEYMVRDKFGNEVWLNQKMLIKKDSKSGHIICLIVLRDITDQMMTRLENERRLSLIEGLTAEYSSVYLVDLKRDKYYIYRLADFIRKRFEEGYADSYDRTMEYYLEHGVYEKDRETVRPMILTEGIRKNLEGRRDYSFIYRTTTDKGPRYYRCMVVRIDKSEGEASEALVGFADVHEEQDNEMRQRQLLEDSLEQARNAGKAKTMFLSNMSHDIRTPMNAIIGFAELAKLHVDDEAMVRESLDNILSSGEHLLELLNNILDLSRIESGRLILKEEPCSLRESIDKLLRFIPPQVKARNLTFTKVIDEDVPDNIYCDILKMKQLILNLLTNAIKYTWPGGHIELRIENAGAPEGYAGITLHVKDNGIGMSPEFVRKLYEPFEREENSVVSQVAGSGLGMTICKSIVGAMGGTITAISTQNVGTEIIVQLEFRLQDADGADHGVREEHGAQELGRYRIFDRAVLKHVPGGKARILLVEDNRMNRAIAGRMLEHLGYEVVMCDSGDAAVELVGAATGQEYDLILMDVHMPGMNGYEAAESIRRIGGGWAWVPIVAMTADAFESDMQRAFQAGMNAFISKPVNLRTMGNVIGWFVGRPAGG